MVVQLFIILLGMGPLVGHADIPRNTCQLSGLVYVTDNPQEADFLVYVQESETAAHLVVYAEENELMADQPGLWHYTHQPGFATFSVYFTPTPKQADFFIAYTDVPAFAGCR